MSWACTCRISWPGRRRGCAATASRSSSPAPGLRAWPRWPATRSPRRAARGSATRTIRRLAGLGRVPKARSAAEARFLAIGDGAGMWLAEAAAAGASRVRPKMADAVQLATLQDAAAVDRRLLHHVHLCQTAGEPVRLAQTLAGAGVAPFSGAR